MQRMGIEPTAYRTDCVYEDVALMQRMGIEPIVSMRMLR